MHSTRNPNTGLIRYDPFEILGVWREYYPNLFTAQDCDLGAQDAMLSNLHRRLSTPERVGCEGSLASEECFEALKIMTRRKTPGSDGFPMGSYLTF